uniref:Uncharacterized protein n=1 Tax=Arundo donax TaxID=35708 RepID=A0A0A8Z5Q5_ARUDO
MHLFIFVLDTPLNTFFTIYTTYVEVGVGDGK